MRIRKPRQRTSDTPLFGEIKEAHTKPPSWTIEAAVKYYRQSGFPFPSLNEFEKISALCELIDLDTSPIITDTAIASDTTGVQMANSYHPHRYDVVCNGNRTPMQLFSNEESLRRVIEKCIYMNGGLSDSKLRSMLQIFEGAQVASNFPPGTAKAIYEQFAGLGATVYDPSMGWGGRMLGAVASSNIRRYFGTDPSTKTCDGLYRMSNEIRSLGFANQMVFELFCHGSEIFHPEFAYQVDLCFTSPPYFDCEKYAREETQSFYKYPTQSQWVNYFLTPTLENCFRYLKSGKFCIINIADVETFKYLTKETVRVAEKVGFTLESTRLLMLSSIPGSGKGKKRKGEVNNYLKSEPVFFFRKP